MDCTKCEHYEYSIMGHIPHKECMSCKLRWPWLEESQFKAKE